MRTSKPILTLVFFVVMAGCSRGSDDPQSHEFAPDVETAIADFVSDAGGRGEYLVSDFDNTTTVFDVGEQTGIYQLQSMSFAMNPSELRDALASGIQNWEEGNFANHIDDIISAYSILWDRYGPFTAAGLSESMEEDVQRDPQWQEFATKMILMYGRVNNYESTVTTYTWILAWLTGMTPDEVYELGLRSHRRFGCVDSRFVTWTSPSEIDSHLGQVSCTWTCGVSVADSVKKLWKTISDSGIDIWVCSASGIDIVKAAIDQFGLHEMCSGVIGMTMHLDSDGKYTSSYEYDKSYAQIPAPGGGWRVDTARSKALIYGEGKVTAITNVLVPKYGKGPAAGFGDSTGDFNFMTEFSSMRLAICFNRADRKVTDGGGLIAEVAIYQRDCLGYDYAAAMADGNTLYLLQGRDENGKRRLRDSNLTVRLDEAVEKLFANDDNYTQMEYLASHRMSVKDAFERFCIATEASDPDNLLGFRYGFCDTYEGYHSM